MAIASVQQFLEITAKHKISLSTQYRLLQFDGCPDYVKREFQEDGGFAYLKSGSIPSRGLGEIDISYQGFKIPYPGQAVYESPQEFTFRMPQDALWRNALEQWSFATYNEVTNNGIGFPCANSIMDVALVNDKGHIVRIYRYYNVWPAKVGSAEYNLADAPSEITFSVSLAFTRWTPVSVTDTGALDDSNTTDEQKAIFDQYRTTIQTAKSACA